MKLVRKFFIPLILSVVIGNLLISCSKVDGDYYTYQNKDAVFEGTILDYIEQNAPEYDSMYRLLSVANLKDTLGDENAQLTVFLFPNDCFDIAMTNLNAYRISLGKSIYTLDSLDSVGVDSLVSRYVLKGALSVDTIGTYAEGLTAYSTFDSSYFMNLKLGKEDAEGYLEGGPQYIEFSDCKRSLTNDTWISAKTKSVNIRAKNGYIHILASGHEFGFTDIISYLNK